MSKNVPDSFVAKVFNEPGQQPVPGNTRNRWGQRLALGNGQPTLKQLVATDTYDHPVPWAVQFRFSTDGITFTPDVPSTFTGGELRVNVIKGLDPQSSPATEEIILVPGDTMPFCALIAQSLQISARLTVEGPSSLWVEAVVAMVSSIDCADVVGPPATTPTGWAEPTTARYAAVTATTYNIVANERRANLTIVNQSAARLFVLLGGGVVITPGSELATIIMPGDSFAGYEVLNYTGPVSFRFDADDADGFALATQGLYPP